MSKIVLASQSPRRKMLLEWAELQFDVLARQTDESFPDNMPRSEVPVHIARQKAQAVQHSAEFTRYESGAIIIAADTVVVLDNRIINKPGDQQEAIGMLQDLSGREHQVITGVVILAGQREWSFFDITRVWFHNLLPEQISYYVDKYRPYDKAGAYAIQEWIGVVGIQRIEGDFYNVMGLPVSRVLQLLDTIRDI